MIFLISLAIYLFAAIKCFSVECSDYKYGAFKYNVQEMKACKGPKKQDCATSEYKLLPGGSTIQVHIEVKEPFIPENVKVSYIMNNGMIPEMRLQMRKPCNDVYLRPIYNILFNTTDTCVIKPGTYNIKYDMAKDANNYFGGKFFYGNVTFKTTIFNKKCNFICSKMDVEMVPLP